MKLSVQLNMTKVWVSTSKCTQASFIGRVRSDIVIAGKGSPMNLNKDVS